MTNAFLRVVPATPSVTSPRGAPAAPCTLDGPPERGLLDRLALLLEGGGRAGGAAGGATLVDLDRVVTGAPAAVADFYRHPQNYSIRTGADAGGWSRALMAVFAALFRQAEIPEQASGFADYAVCQRVYRDPRGRTHWDRYARVGGR